MHKTALPLCLLPAILITGCIDADTDIIINKDGSGTITETVLMEKQSAKSLAGMMAGMRETLGNKNKQSAEPVTWWKKEDIEKRASKMGEGVSLQSVEPYETDTGIGYKATFAFKDVNKIRLEPDPNSHAPEQPEQNQHDGNSTSPTQRDADDVATSTTPEEETICFTFTAGNPARLSINMPNPKPSSEQSQPSPSESQTAQQEESNPFVSGMMGAMGQMFKGMRVKSTLTVQGEIVQTNAAYRDGSSITLMEIDFEKLLSDAKLMEKFIQNENSFSKNLSLFKDNPGVKFDPNNPITIEFR